MYFIYQVRLKSEEIANKLYWHHVAEQEAFLVVLIGLSHVFDSFLYPPVHPEQMRVEAVLSIAVAAFAPRHDAYLVPAVLSRVLHG